MGITHIGCLCVVVIFNCLWNCKSNDMSVNKVMLLGNICQDPAIKTFENGGKIAQFSLATNKRGYKTKDGRDIPERTEFHNIVINASGLAEVAEKYLHKGDKIYLEGELRTRQYESNGVKHYITEIYVATMEMLTPKASGQSVPPPPAPAPAPEQNDDLPF